MTELANPDARYWFPIEEGYAHLDDQGVARIKTIIKKSVEPLAKADSRGRLARQDSGRAINAWAGRAARA